MTKSQQFQLVEAEADLIAGKFTKEDEKVFDFLAPTPDEEEDLEDETDVEVLPDDPEAGNPRNYLYV